MSVPVPGFLTFSVGVVASIALSSSLVFAHDGPPFPIVSNRIAGPYDVSIWTDPDSTDDGSAGGRFWITLGTKAGPVPADTRVDVSIEPVNRAGTPSSVRAEPVSGAVTNQLASLVMDHEGRFRVRVAVTGPLGRADVDGEVEATYDLRPAPFLILVYVTPFVLVAFLWVKLMLRRRKVSGYRDIGVSG